MIPRTGVSDAHRRLCKACVLSRAHLWRPEQRSTARSSRSWSRYPQMLEIAGDFVVKVKHSVSVELHVRRSYVAEGERRCFDIEQETITCASLCPTTALAQISSQGKIEQQAQTLHSNIVMHSSDAIFQLHFTPHAATQPLVNQNSSRPIAAALALRPARCSCRRTVPMPCLTN